MLQIIDHIFYRDLSEEYPRIRIFRKCLLLYCVFFIIQSLFEYQLLFDPSASFVLPAHPQGRSLLTLMNLLSLPTMENFTGLFFAVAGLSALSGFFDFYPKISLSLTFFTITNIQNRIYPTLTGGDELLSMMLFYLIFISNGKKSACEIWETTRKSLDRAFVFVCKAQLILVYVISALFKWMSPEWLQGEALSQILNTPEFSLFFLQPHLPAMHYFLAILTWLSLAYLSLFPIFIFIKPARKNLLIIGLAFHACIAIFMGLLNFSLVMVCCYTLFYTPSFFSKIPALRPAQNL